MKRRADKHTIHSKANRRLCHTGMPGGYTYSVNTAVRSGLYVKCPECDSLGIVTADDKAVSFQCTNCVKNKTENRLLHSYKVENQCGGCRRFYRVNLSDAHKQPFSMLRVACPHCGYVMPGKVLQAPGGQMRSGEIQNGREPFFGFELWFLTNFRGKLIWALNRDHLAYLIDYLSAGLREEPLVYGTMRMPSDHLPAFMKTAKNRDRIVKELKKMLEKIALNSPK